MLQAALMGSQMGYFVAEEGAAAAEDGEGNRSPRASSRVASDCPGEPKMGPLCDEGVLYVDFLSYSERSCWQRSWWQRNASALYSILVTVSDSVRVATNATIEPSWVIFQTVSATNARESS